MPRTLRLILGDQLNHQHSWFSSADDNVTYVMMEMRQETDYVKHHVQKVLAFFGAMRRFADWLRERGHQVVYYRLDEKDNAQDLTKNLSALLRKVSAKRFEYQLPDEYRLDRQLADFCAEIELPTEAVDSEHFLTSRYELRDFFGEKNFLMENFYRHIRRRGDYLMDGKDPLGGKWNYDHQNRKSLPKNKEVITPLTFRNDVSDLHQLIQEHGVETFGKVTANNFIWPLDRSQALSVLRFFLDECFADFGNYQDAMHTDYWSLYHARISFALNAKLISPAEVVERAIERFHEDDSIKIAATEGFVRQIIGWREFMRGVYWAKMPDYAESNYLDHRRHLPKWYWTGETKMNCLSHAITQSLEYAYAHHIQRLMITGNFALLANIDPDQVDAWYLGVYIDAIEWVEITNTRGMSQFADGGVVATKPYISSANYVNKMSNYCKGCHYDRKIKTGENACPFNSLYWNFLDRHQDKFRNNGRMNMMYALLDKMDSQDREAILHQAESYLRKIDDL